MMNDKVTKSFDDFYLYDASIRYTKPGEPYLFIDKIKVLSEVLLEGACETVYDVKYMGDRHIAYISKDMYHTTEDSAISALIKEG